MAASQDDEAPAESPAVPDYHELLQVPDANSADLWGWEWTGPEQELVPTVATREPDRWE